jgi:hypothetical protein
MNSLLAVGTSQSCIGVCMLSCSGHPILLIEWTSTCVSIHDSSKSFHRSHDKYVLLLLLLLLLPMRVTYPQLSITTMNRASSAPGANISLLLSSRCSSCSVRLWEVTVHMCCCKGEHGTWDHSVHCTWVWLIKPGNGIIALSTHEHSINIFAHHDS